MKMRNLLFGVFLGLVAVVHSTPVFTPAEDDFDREAKTEDFLVDEYLLPSLTTESPKRNTTVPATQQPMSESKESDMTEGSGANYVTITPTSTTTVMADDANRVLQPGVTSPSDPDEALFTDDDVIEDTMLLLHEDEHYQSTTTSVPHTQSSTSTPFPMPADDFSSHSSTTRAPQSGVTSPSEQDEDLFTDDDVIEDNMFLLHEDEHYQSTTTSVPHTQSSTSTPFPMPADDFSSHSSTTRAPQSGVTSPSEQDDALSRDNDIIEDTTVMSTTPKFFLHEDEHYKSTTPSVTPTQSSTSTPFLMLADGSGFGEDPEEGSGTELPGILSTTTRRSTTSTSTAETSTASSTPKKEAAEERIIAKEVVQNNAVQGLQITPPDTTKSPMNAGHSTPGWIIIVGFIVGVAALVMLCVAIATRDKWNGPRQASQPKANPSNQQRELEMETFLHNDSPKENGKAAEYTVIPLDELPEKYSSH